jgi:hydroxymethylbilane synthase
VAKVVDGEYDATVLALAGLKRLGLTGAITEMFDPAHFLPAPGQGAIAVQIRSGDGTLRPLVQSLDDRRARLATTAERALLGALQGGCQAPVGASGTWLRDEMLGLEGLVASYDGRTMIRASVADTVTSDTEATTVAARLARILRARGAERVLAECRAAVAAAPHVTLEDLA